MMSIFNLEFWDQSNMVLAILIIFWIFSSRDNENLRIKSLFRKILITLDSFLFMVWSKDSKGIGSKYNSDPERIKNFPCRSKRIVFIRHGESDWNNVFNKGINISFPIRLISALLDELLLIFRMDSTFLDSPLNSDGIEQALELRRFLYSINEGDKLYEIAAILRGEKSTSVIASSTLRRAIATTALVLWPRLEKKNEKICLLSNLQEISRNIDTRALSSASEVADLPFKRILPHCPVSKNSKIEDYFDATENFGNKTRNFYGIKRLRSFADWAFKREELTIIVGGHSLWFKSFFQTFLPNAIEHPAKSKKIANSGVVTFTLQQAIDQDNMFIYAIDPQSIEVVYGGFESK